jgi:hypothetical protein
MGSWPDGDQAELPDQKCELRLRRLALLPGRWGHYRAWMGLREQRSSRWRMIAPCPSTVAALEHPAHAAWPRYGKLVAPHLAVQLLDRRYGAGGRTAEDCPQ